MKPSLILEWSLTATAPHGPDHDCPLCERVRVEVGHVSLAELERTRRELDTLGRAVGVDYGR